MDNPTVVQERPTSLPGTSQDWTVTKDTGAIVVLSSPKFGVEASAHRLYHFIGEIYEVRGGRLVPQFTLPTTSGYTQADLDKARADGRAEGIAAARAALAGVR